MFRKPAIALFVGLMLGIVVLAGCHLPWGGHVSSSSSSSSGSSGTPATAKAILDNLGVNEVSNPPAATVETQTGTTETIDPSTWQPLKSKYAVFTPQAEIFQAGGSPGAAVPSGSTPVYGDGTYWNSFYESSTSNGTTTYNTTAPFIGGGGSGSWEQSAAKTSVAADLTGDGVDNIVVFYVNKPPTGTTPTLNDIVYSPPTSGSGKGSFGTPQVVSGVPLDNTSGQTVFDHWEPSTERNGIASGIGTPWFPYFSCTKADLDGNGVDEILLADYETLYVLSVDPSGAVTVLNSISESSPISSVAAGDYNGSGRDDIVVGVQGDEYSLYNSRLTSVNYEVPAVAGATANSPVEATFGNFEGNGLEELALCAQASDGNIEVSMFDYNGSNEAHVTSFEDNLNPFEGNANTSWDYFRMLPRAIDVTGSGTDALSVLGSIYENPMTITSGTTPAATYAAGSYTTATAPINTAASYPNPNDNTVVDMEVGNVNTGGLGQGVTDPRQDLIVLSVGENSENSVPDINVFGLKSGTTTDFTYLEEVLESNNSSSLASIDQYGTSTTIAVGNFEDNSPRVEYVGHELTFTNPVVIAALASPPYWSDIAESDSGYGNAYTGWNTTLGETSAGSTDNSHSVSFKVGAEVQYEGKASIFGFTIAKFEASVAFTNTNSWEWDSSYEVAKSIQWNCPGGQNMVIFTSIPMDQYQYKVVATDDPTNSPVGSSLYITIPREYTTYFVSQAFYNSHINTSIVQPISNSVFGGPNSNFTIGDPASYPSPSTAQTMMDTGFQSYSGFTNVSTAETDYQIAQAAVAEGANNVSGGSTNLDISLTSSTSETISHDFELDTSAGAGAGDVTVLATAGFQGGYSTTSEVSTSTTFGGTVGYLPDSYYNNPNYNYKAGLFVYPYKQPNNTIFWVVDYDVTTGTGG